MKKMLFALLAIVAASSVYAAQFDWEFNAEGYDPFPGAQYFAFNLTSADGLAGYVTTLTTEGKGYDAFVESLTGANYVSGSLDNAGAVTGVFEEAKTHFGIIVFDSTTADSTFYYQTLATEGYDYTPPGNSPGVLECYAFTEDGVLDMNTGTVAKTIPEPTVLALLALGVAGLALKRKNA